MKKILFCILGILITHIGIAQNETAIQNPTVIPPSPQAAAFAKYVETPVSHFNGTTNISIPIYTINQGKISVPIGLSYHSGGIKVSEEASWVGLGWSLQAGGQITRIVRGVNDDRNKERLNTVYPNSSDVNGNLAESNINAFGSNHYNNNGQPTSFFNTFADGELVLGGEADLYIYNFGEYSGKFIYAQGVVYDLSHNEIAFKKLDTSIEATDPNGFKYVFDVTELTLSQSMINGDNPLIPSSTTYTNSTFYLSKIQSPYDSTNEILFEYKDFLEVKNELGVHFGELNQLQIARQLPNFDEQYVISSDPQITGPNHKRSGTWSAMNTMYLDKITFKNGSIDFIKGYRNDLHGFKLDAIKVYANNQTSPVLDLALNYTDFYGDIQKGGDYLTHLIIDSAYPENYRSYRLKLLNIQDITNTNDIQKHSFKYYEDLPLPYKTSHAQDYWGYYNGKSANKTLIPDYKRYLRIGSLPTALRNWKGAIREPSLVHARLGSLKEVKYPTGGTTTLEYEMHQYSNTKDFISGPSYEPVTISARDFNENGSGFTESEEFVIEEHPSGNNNLLPSVDIKVGLFCNSNSLCPPNNALCGDTHPTLDYFKNMYAGLMKKNNNGSWSYLTSDWWDYRRAEINDCNDGTPRMHSYTNTNLPPGTYKIKVNYPDHFGLGSAQSAGYHAFMNVTYFKLQEQEDQIDSGIGGGLRIAKIISSTEDTDKTIEKIYEYQDGIMTRFPIFYYYTHKTKCGVEDIPVINQTIPKCLTFDYSYLYSNTVVPYSNAANGSMVGYKKVIEYQNENGRTEYQYHIEADELDFQLDQQTNLSVMSLPLPLAPIGPQYLPGTPSTSNILNGKVKDITTFAQRNPGGRSLRKIQYKYEILNPKVFWNFKLSRERLQITDPRFVLLGDYPYNLSFYADNIAKVVTSEVTSTDIYSKNIYDPSVPIHIPGSRSVSQTITTKYNSNHHLFPTEVIVNTSEDDNQTYNTLFIYPEDYRSEGITQELINANMIQNPIEIIQYSEKNRGLPNTSRSVLSGKITSYKRQNENGFGLQSEIYAFENQTPISLSDFKFSNKTSNGQWPFNTTTNVAFNSNTIDNRYSKTPKQSFGYNNKGNLTEVTIENSKDITYIWGYNDSYPIAKIENATYDQIGIYVNNLKVKSNADTDHCNAIACKEQQLREALQNFRESLPNAMVTSYTYDPMIGITSMTDPRGYTIYYEYDAAYRLKAVRDASGNLVSENKYNYKN